MTTRLLYLRISPDGFQIVEILPKKVSLADCRVKRHMKRHKGKKAYALRRTDGFSACPHPPSKLDRLAGLPRKTRKIMAAYALEKVRQRRGRPSRGGSAC